MEIARSNHRKKFPTFFRLALDRDNLTVHFQPFHAGLDLNAFFAHLFQVVDVVLLVKSRLKFDDYAHPLPIFGCINQSGNHPRLRRQAIQCNGNGFHLRIHGTFAQKANHIGKRMVWG